MAGKYKRRVIMSKKNDRNSLVANVSSVWSYWGKSELETFSRRNGGL